MSVPLREPLHVFSIPQQIAQTLVPRASPGTTAAAPPPPSSAADDQEQVAPSGSLTCATCLGVSFNNVNDQRNHFRSDWHRYNVKARMQDSNADAVDEAQFANLVEGLDESLSGSASSSSEEDDSDEDAVSTLLARKRKSKKNNLNGSTSSSDERPLKVPRSPVVWLQSPDVPDTQLGVYTTLFPNDAPVDAYPAALHAMQDGGDKGRTWALFMTAGGHFAGMIVRVAKPGIAHTSTTAPSKKSGKGGGGKPQPEYQIIAHKTFHRYTTRRKQGGSQSVNDNANGKAKSAGAQLRRYGEQALREDIQGLLLEWVEELDACERIFIRASVTNRRIFLESEDSIIQKGDERLRTFPFPTRRPTLAELTRCLTELTRVKVSHLTEEALRAIDEAYLASLPKPTPKPSTAQQEVKKPAAPKAPQLSPEEELLRDKWRRLVEMIRKGRLEVLQSFWARESSSFVESSEQPNLNAVDVRVPAWFREEERDRCGATLLQIASAAGQEDVTRWLLVELHADPTIPVPSSLAAIPVKTEEQSDNEVASTSTSTSRAAYDLAPTRAVRNIFRRAAYAHPDWWDWMGTGRVPSVLSPEKEEEAQRKKGARRKGLKERAKEREEEQAVAAAERQKREEEEARALERIRREGTAGAKKSTGPQKLGGGVSGGGLAGNAGLAGMSAEMRARIERERRARAAEARLTAK